MLLSDDVTGPLLPLLVPEVKRPSVLQVVNVPVVTNQRCERWHQNAGIKVRPEWYRESLFKHSQIKATSWPLFASSGSPLWFTSVGKAVVPDALPGFGIIPNTFRRLFPIVCIYSDFFRCFVFSLKVDVFLSRPTASKGHNFRRLTFFWASLDQGFP